MLRTKPVGRGASSQKYDIITAMGSYALSLDKFEQRRILRLITLITARYNWSRNELNVGQREIARLWSCDERTVKRETATLRGLGWFVVKRQGARGRVTQYQIDFDKILKDTRSSWQNVGPDFEQRLEGQCADQQGDQSVVPFPKAGKVDAPDVSAGTEWALARAILYREDEAGYGAWLQTLQRDSRAGGRLMLFAPSRFHATYVQAHYSERILAACRAVDGAVSEIAILY